MRIPVVDNLVDQLLYLGRQVIRPRKVAKPTYRLAAGESEDMITIDQGILNTPTRETRQLTTLIEEHPP